MRNLTAELRFFNRLLVIAGLLLILGLGTILASLQYWIIVSLSGPAFWMAEGIWIVLLGLLLSLVGAAGIKQRQ